MKKLWVLQTTVAKENVLMNEKVEFDFKEIFAILKKDVVFLQTIRNTEV